MEVLVAALCDSAADYNGKLCVLGAFDTIVGKGLPIRHPQCSIAFRLVYFADDEGEHKMSVRFVNADGVDMIPPFEPTVTVKLPFDHYFMTRNLVINLQRLELHQLGAYSIDVIDNGEEVASIPLRVMMAGSGKN